MTALSFEREGLVKKVLYVEFTYSKSSFLDLKFLRNVTQFYGICRGKALFCPEFPRVK